MPGYGPNRVLRILLGEAGWSGQDLANAVKAAGAEVGLALQYDRASTAHWLSGMRPRPPVPELIAEVLTRRLGRPITTTQAGLADGTAGGTVGLDRSDAVARLRAAKPAPAYRLDALAVPSWVQALSAALARPRPVEVFRAGPAQVKSVTAMMAVFGGIDDAFGGGRARRALRDYLVADVTTWLRAPADRAVRRRLMSAATELTYLCAFMHLDDEQHHHAQHYYQITLALAAENGDRTSYAITLRAMSVQAWMLGHHKHARNLSQAAIAEAPAALTPATRAFLHGQAAVTAAATKDRRTALTELRRAENLLSRACSSATPSIGTYDQAALANQQAAVLAALGDTPAAAAALVASLRHRPRTERRSRAITTAHLAELHLDQGHLEQAAATWHRFLDDYPHLDSGRAHTALATLRARLRPHQRNTAAAAVLHRAAQNTTTPCAPRT